MPFDISILQKAAVLAEEGRADTFTSLTGSSGALLFSLLQFPCMVICASDEKAEEFYSDATFWSKFFDEYAPVLIPPEGHPGRLTHLSNLYATLPLKVVTSVDATLPSLWSESSFPSLTVSKGGSIERDSFIHDLHQHGYTSASVVSGQGEISVRGGIIDIFTPDNENPLRIELFGDEIESLRFFDIDTQLSIQEIESARISPVIEPEEGPNLIDLLPESKIILIEPDDIKKHYPEFDPMLAERTLINFISLPLEGEGFRCEVSSISGLGLLRDERKSVQEFVNRAIVLRKQYFIFMACSSEGQAKRLKELFIDQGSDAPILSDSEIDDQYRAVISVGELSRGFMCSNTVLLTERDIFGQRPAYKPIKKSRVSKLISTIEDFNKGDYLVHIEHGIGQFLGIKKERMEDYEGDFITIEYLGGDRLFVPLERMNYVQKYHAPENVKPKIDRLGGKTWQRTRQKVKKKIKDMAEKLIKIYAKRTTAAGNAFSDDSELHREFDGFFPYEETPDQLSSINEIKRDMEQAVPMDRLLCGDVGYGKTEVVMRACFKAVYDGKQVAVLVPTTILAEQHHETFETRFSAFPVTIDFLSRFKTSAEQKETLKKLENGDIDIIIGTHRLLGKDVAFHNLGLLVVDEEHKFGVTHKEKIKAFKANVDVLSLSATPIPRTLHMALSGIRGVSTIETPPEDRLAVQSRVARFRPTLIKEVLQKELDRGGQAFFVHNRVHDIYKMAAFLDELLPEGTLGIAHGQMKEKELEQVMKKFFHKEIDILVSTSIIGSGLDIPSANTIVINRADRFGLADLYQLRGRVGRSNVKAFAYFLIPGEDIISEEARKKLAAIQELGYLGAGFRLALKDLEIRGAGNLLGGEQSGHIEAVGFDMYMDMLETAVAELKGEKTTPKIEPEIDLKVTASIPEEYIEDPDLRLSIYRKIATAKDQASLQNIRIELRDRFGQLPEKAVRLVEIMEIKVAAVSLFIIKIQNVAGKVRVLFAPETPVSTERIFALHDTRKKLLKFLPEGGIELDLRGKKWNDVYREVMGVMKELSGDSSQ
jgi:transcription-repair coupling factor (superfamily II helicase)